MEAGEPWEIVENSCKSITHLIEILDDEFEVKDGVAIHRSAIIGHDVNIEAGSILCNHYNEREDDTVKNFTQKIHPEEGKKLPRKMGTFSVSKDVRLVAGRSLLRNKRF